MQRASLEAVLARADASTTLAAERHAVLVRETRVVHAHLTRAHIAHCYKIEETH